MYNTNREQRRLLSVCVMGVLALLTRGKQLTVAFGVLEDIVSLFHIFVLAQIVDDVSTLSIVAGYNFIGNERLNIVGKECERVVKV